MTSDERKTLEALHDAAMTSIPAMNAIRAALAEVDRLNGLRPEVGPFPPEGRGLPRYGIRWNGPGEPLAVPMPDGYWTPYHLALAEVDAIHEDLGSERSRVTNLCRLITGRAADNELSNERLGEACREANRMRAEVDALRSQVSDLAATLDGAVDLRKSIEREREEARYQADALTQQVATLNRDRALMHADRIIDAATIADLEARAIPKNACLHLANGTTIEEDDGVFLVWTRDDRRATTDPVPTLSAALSAAKDES